MSIILDISVVAIILIFLLIGLKNGMAKTLFSLIKTIVAVVVSILLGQLAAQAIYESFIKTNLISDMEKAINDASGGHLDEIENALNQVPNFIINLLPNFGIDTSSISSDTNSSQGLANNIESTISPVIVLILSAICILLIYIIVSLLLKLLDKLISKIVKLPVINGADRILGGVFGVAIGLVIVMGLVFVIKIFVPYIDAQISQAILNPQAIEDTIVFKHIYAIIPNSFLLTY